MQHFFISSIPLAPTARWVAAFPQGEVLTPTALPKRLQGLKATEFVVWLTTDDPQWRQMVALTVQSFPGARAVLLSGVPNPAEGIAALEGGAMGYTHAYGLPELLQEVATVVKFGGLWAGPELLSRIVSSTAAALAKLPAPANGPGVVAQNNALAWTKLSAREAQVAQSVALGRSNKEVADKLFISERTVKAHMSSVFDKLGVRDRLQLTLLVATLPPEALDARGEEA